MFEKMQDLSLRYRDSRYYNGEIFIIIPKYPIMEIVTITLDDDFVVQSVDVGSIQYDNGLLYTHVNDEVTLLQDDTPEDEYFHMGREIDLLHIGWLQKEINLPQVGDKLIKLKQNYSETIIHRNDFDVSRIIEKYKDSVLVQFNEELYIIKDDEIIDRFPRDGETEYITIAEQNADKTVIDYQSNERYDYTKKAHLEIIYQ
jgi:hypothetical protein